MANQWGCWRLEPIYLGWRMKVYVEIPIFLKNFWCWQGATHKIYPFPTNSWRFKHWCSFFLRSDMLVFFWKMGWSQNSGDSTWIYSFLLWETNWDLVALDLCFSSNTILYRLWTMDVLLQDCGKIFNISRQWWTIILGNLGPLFLRQSI